MAETLQRVGESDIITNLSDLSERIEEIKSAKVSVIANADDFRKASDYLGNVKFLIKTVDVRRVELKAPSLEEGKRVDSKCKAIIKPLEEFQKKLEIAMNDWGLAEAKRKEEEQRKWREAEAKRLEAEKEELLKKSIEEAEAAKIARENGDVQTVSQSECVAAMTLSQAEAIEEDQERLMNKPVKGIARTLGADGSMSTSTEWAFEIINADLVPRPYCEADESKVRKAVKSGVREIPGVRIYEKAKFTNR